MRIMLVLTHFGKDIYAGRLGIVQDLLFYFILMNIWVVLKSLKKNIQEQIYSSLMCKKYSDKTDKIK